MAVVRPIRPAQEAGFFNQPFFGLPSVASMSLSDLPQWKQQARRAGLKLLERRKPSLPPHHGHREAIVRRTGGRLIRVAR